MLDYKRGDYCCLHQDLYGAQPFPIQSVAALSRAEDFISGEFLRIEQDHTASRADVAPLGSGPIKLLADHRFG